MELPAGTPGYIVIFIAVCGAVLPILRWASDESPKVAKALGPLGRRWQTREQRRVERARAARREAAEDVDARIEVLEGEVEVLRKQLDPLRQFRDYVLLYDAAWHLTADLRAAAAELKLPSHMGFEDWVKVTTYQGGPPQADRR